MAMKHRITINVTDPNGKKAAGNEILREGDRITLYLADALLRYFVMMS